MGDPMKALEKQLRDVRRMQSGIVSLPAVHPNACNVQLRRERGLQDYRFRKERASVRTRKATPKRPQMPPVREVQNLRKQIYNARDGTFRAPPPSERPTAPLSLPPIMMPPSKQNGRRVEKVLGEWFAHPA
jgi:hypothetical protein